MHTTLHQVKLKHTQPKIRNNSAWSDYADYVCNTKKKDGSRVVAYPLNAGVGELHGNQPPEPTPQPNQAHLLTPQPPPYSPQPQPQPPQKAYAIIGCDANSAIAAAIAIVLKAIVLCLVEIILIHPLLNSTMLTFQNSILKIVVVIKY